MSRFFTHLSMSTLVKTTRRRASSCDCSLSTKWSNESRKIRERASIPIESNGQRFACGSNRRLRICKIGFAAEQKEIWKLVSSLKSKAFPSLRFSSVEVLLRAMLLALCSSLSCDAPAAFFALVRSSLYLSLVFSLLVPWAFVSVLLLWRSLPIETDAFLECFFVRIFNFGFGAMVIHFP